MFDSISESREPAEETGVIRADGPHGLPAGLLDLGEAITPDLLERYIAHERRRNVKALRWIASILLLLIFAVSGLLMALTLGAARRAESADRKAEEAGSSVRLAAADMDRKMGLVSSDIFSVKDKSSKTAAALDQEKKKILNDRLALRKDLEEFSRWHERRFSGIRAPAAPAEEMRRRIEELEAEARARQERLAEIEEWYCVEKERRSAVSTTPAVAGVAFASGMVPAPTSGVERIEYPNGGRYEGQMAEGRKNGRGVFHYPNGDSYAGEFLDDFRHGRGIYVHGSGDRYEGEFRNGRRHGHGVYKYANGDVFEGMFAEDMKNGPGVYMGRDGLRVQGVWRDDVMVPANKR